MPDDSPASLCRQIAELLPEGTEVPGWRHYDDRPTDGGDVWVKEDTHINGLPVLFCDARDIDLAAFTYAAEETLFESGLLLVQSEDFFVWMTPEAFHNHHCVEWYDTRPLAALAALKAVKEQA